MIVRATCRVCHGEFDPILSLGDHYVSNFILPGEPDGTRAPLDLVLCKRCHLLQLRHTVPGEDMYRNYWYRSGTNATMREALADIALKAETLVHLQPNDSVLDIGCNDGTLLAAYRTQGIKRIGFDPAENLAPLSRRVADTIMVTFFDADVFLEHEQLRTLRPKIVTSIAMFYDLEEPRKFVAGIKRVMHPDGLWIVQMSYLPMMLKEHELGNICHEHLEYYSLQSFEYLLSLEGFEIVDLELNAVNGGSLRAYIRNKSANANAFADATYRELASTRVRALREEEVQAGLDEVGPYKEFAFWVDRIKNDVVGFIRDEVASGKQVYVYGASTKGNTVLQYYGLDASVIKAAAERNAEKWGRMTVGTHIPIVSEEEARRANPEYFLVLPWHFLAEFQKREHDYLMRGGRFIVPAPYLTII